MVTCALIGILTALGISYTAPMARHRAFGQFALSVVDALNQARAYALRTGSRAAVSIEDQRVVAFVDSNNNQRYDAGEQVIVSFPKDLQKTIDPGFTMASRAMRERNQGPQTAFLDSRGFYIDAHDGASRHEANICLTDTTTSEQKKVNLSIFGHAAIVGDSCSDSDGPTCPNVNAS